MTTGVKKVVKKASTTAAEKTIQYSAKAGTMAIKHVTKVCLEPHIEKLEGEQSNTLMEKALQATGTLVEIFAPVSTEMAMSGVKYATAGGAQSQVIAVGDDDVTALTVTCRRSRRRPAHGRRFGKS